VTRPPETSAPTVVPSSRWELTARSSSATRPREKSSPASLRPLRRPLVRRFVVQAVWSPPVSRTARSGSAIWPRFTRSARRWLDRLCELRPASSMSFWDLQQFALLRAEAVALLLNAGFPDDPFHAPSRDYPMDLAGKPSPTLDCLAQVFEQVPAIGDLPGIRRGFHGGSRVRR